MLPTPDELSGATFVMIQGDSGDAALNQFLTLDSSAIYQISETVNSDNDVVIGDCHSVSDADAGVVIPLAVRQATEPVAGTSGAQNIAIKSSASVFGDDAPADTTSSEKSRGGKKRKAPSSVLEDEDWADDGSTLSYQEKRRRNNIAVRKSRAQAKERQKTTEEENDKLREENEKKSREIEMLQREIQIYKELFERSGFNMPRVNNSRR